MPSSSLENLQQKVKEAASQLSFLRKDRDRLLAEVKLMERENKNSRRVLQDHKALLQEREKMKKKLESLLEKLERLKV